MLASRAIVVASAISAAIVFAPSILDYGLATLPQAAKAEF